MGELGINWQVLVAQLVNFFILFGLLAFFAYKPIRGMMEKRAAKIKEGLDQAETVRQQAAEAEERVRAQLDKSREEAQKIIAQATQTGEKMKEEARAEARKEAEAIMVRGREEITIERNKAMSELRKEVVDIAILAAEKVVRRNLDSEAQRRLVQEVLEQSGPKKG